MLQGTTNWKPYPPHSAFGHGNCYTVTTATNSAIIDTERHLTFVTFDFQMQTRLRLTVKQGCCLLQLHNADKICRLYVI